MAEFLIILAVVAVFLVIFYSSVVHEKRELPQAEPKEEPQERKAA
jgi:hypothetical protein